MKDNIFAHWLKELCSLVFIQSIQAFIFAIVMALIISIMTPENVGEIGDDNRSDYIAATGMIAILAITSISKLEELVKKIFGVQSNVTDTGMKGGLKSLATTMMAANLAKGVLDNAGKVVGGIGEASAAKRGMNRQRARLARKIGNEASPPQAISNTENSNNLRRNNNSLNNDIALELPKNKNSTTTGMSTRNNIQPVSSSNRISKTKDLQKAYDDYEDKMQDLKAKRRAGRYKAFSGLTETVGAIGGGVIGATAGAALGEGKEIMNGALTGIGVGDKIGAAPIKMTKTTSDFSHAVKDISAQKQNLVNAVNDMSKDAKTALNDKKKIVTKYSVARKELDKQLQSFDVSDL